MEQTQVPVAPAAGPAVPPALPRRTGFLTGVVSGVIGAGLVVAVVMVGLSMAGAQTNSPSPSSGSRSGLPEGPGAFPGWFGHGGPELGFGAIHGQFTVPAPSGGYETLATQTGTVSSVSATSITVKSEDGFTGTYTVDDDTLVNAGNNGIADVSKGDTVRVVAVIASGRDRAVQIMDGTKVQRSIGRWLPGFPGAPGSPTVPSGL